jgi:hypothetical protein
MSNAEATLFKIIHNTKALSARDRFVKLCPEFNSTRPRGPCWQPSVHRANHLNRVAHVHLVLQQPADGFALPDEAYSLNEFGAGGLKLTQSQTQSIIGEACDGARQHQTRDRLNRLALGIHEVWRRGTGFSGKRHFRRLSRLTGRRRTSQRFCCGDQAGTNQPTAEPLTTVYVIQQQAQNHRDDHTDQKGPLEELSTPLPVATVHAGKKIIQTSFFPRPQESRY